MITQAAQALQHTLALIQITAPRLLPITIDDAILQTTYSDITKDATYPTNDSAIVVATHLYRIVHENLFKYNVYHFWGNLEILKERIYLVTELGWLALSISKLENLPREPQNIKPLYQPHRGVNWSHCR